jgi:ATP-binding cassette subfamily F protein 3
MLTIENLHKQYGAQKILEDAELFVGWGDRVGLVGPNGTGKTTIFRMIAGLEEPDSGKVRFDDHVSCDMLLQESQCRLGVTVREEMLSAFREADAAQANIEALSAKLGGEDGFNADSFEHREALRQLSQAQTQLEMQESHTMEARIGRVLKGLGFGDDALDRLTDTYSGGWQMRIAMAKLLLREPDLLLLDEPTNHLDMAARKWLQNYLDEYPGSVFLISHEPKFLDAVCSRIVELDEHKLRDYTGNYSNYHRVKHEESERQIAAYERQQRELERQQEFIDRFGAKTPRRRRSKAAKRCSTRWNWSKRPKPRRARSRLCSPLRPSQRRTRYGCAMSARTTMIMSCCLKSTCASIAATAWRF